MKELKLNLQLFADDTGLYATVPIVQQTTANIADPYANTSSSVLAGLTPEIKEFYSSLLIKKVGPALIHAQFGEKEALPKGHGSTIEWRKWEDFKKATTPLTEGVTPEASKISVNPVRATLNQYGAWTGITDKLQLTAIDNVIVEVTEKYAENAKLTLDTIVREKLISGCTNAAYAGGVDAIYKLEAKFTAKDAAKLATYLKNNNAPKIDGAYVCMVHPSVVYDLITSDDWIDVVKYENSVKIFDGEVGKLYGVRFVESTEAKVNKAKALGTGTAGNKTAIEVVSFNGTTITVAADTFVADELNGKKICIQDTSASTTTVVEATVTDTTTNTIVLSAAPSFTPAAGDIVYSNESAVGGQDYFTCIVLGSKAYKVVDINGSNAEMIVEPSRDPLHQRITVGWKVDAFTAAVINDSYIYKFYCCSSITGVAAND